VTHSQEALIESKIDEKGIESEKNVQVMCSLTVHLFDKQEFIE